MLGRYTTGPYQPAAATWPLPYQKSIRGGIPCQGVAADIALVTCAGGAVLWLIMSLWYNSLKFVGETDGSEEERRNSTGSGQ